jgi:hypothetical protein
MFFADKQEIFEVTSPYDIIDRLRPPLSARVMVLFFKKFSDLPDGNARDKANFVNQQNAFEDELDL